jgi:hypothetical protein
MGIIGVDLSGVRLCGVNRVSGATGTGHHLTRTEIPPSSHGDQQFPLHTETETSFAGRERHVDVGQLLQYSIFREACSYRQRHHGCA